MQHTDWKRALSTHLLVSSRKYPDSIALSNSVGKAGPRLIALTGECWWPAGAREGTIVNCGACYSPRVWCGGCKGYHCQCSWSGRSCRTWFRKHLNKTHAEYAHHKNKRFEQRTRPYGDYLYYQDREKFEVEFKEWAQGKERMCGE